MEQDAYQIFTRAHQVYIKGIRAGIAECLKSAYGSDWWEFGVLSALGDDQRENLERDRQKVVPEDLAQLLDTAHFSRIVERNHAAAFTNQFTNIDYTVRLFRHLSAKRNEWAHVNDRQWTVPNIMQSVQAMREILISLRRREALEIHQMFQDSLDHQVSIPQELLNVPEDPTPATEDDDCPLPADYALLAFWRTLESYLVVESTVQPARDEEQNEELVKVLVRVTNTAPASEGRPDVTFRKVRLELTGTKSIDRRGRNHTEIEWDSLSRGQTETSEFVVAAKGLASIEFRVHGQVDHNRLLRVQHRNTLPERDVTPLLEQISIQFEGVGIEEALAKVVETSTRIQPDMPFGEVSALRNELGQLKLLITQKREALDALFGEYHLTEESPLGTPLLEVILLLREMETKKIDEMDRSISQTDMESIRAVSRDFEQLQISVLRARETIRQRMTLPP
jgi:hypothetical protein